MAIKEGDDIIRDVLMRVRDRIGPIFLSHRDMEELELDIKADWGGTEPWIDTGKSLRVAKRDLSLIRKWDSGASRKDLRDQFKISDKTIYRILTKYNRT